MSLIEKTGEILPLKPNKNVRIIKRENGYLVKCLRTEMTPGAYAVVSVEPETWYTVDIRCMRLGGLPGLWIGTVQKKTLFYNNFFSDYAPTYLRRNFFSGPYNTLLVGVLIKNATHLSGYFISQFSVSISPDQPESSEKTALEELEDQVNAVASVKEEEPKVSMKSIRVQEPKVSLQPTGVQDIEKTPSEQTLVQDTKDQNVSYQSILLDESVQESEDESDEQTDTKNNKDQFIYRIKESITGDEKGVMIIEVKSYTSSKNMRVYPISFGVPENKVLDYMPEKKRDFFPQNIGENPIDTYKNDSDRYWQDLQDSRFFVAGKFGVGWENLMIVEALSQGCIPLFIEDIPQYACQFLPKVFLDGVRKAKGVHIGWIDHHLFSREAYVKMANYLLQYTKNHLTTKAMARYLLSTTGKEVSRVLALAFGYDEGDYLMQQSLIHGLKELLGNENVFDVPKVDSLFDKNARAMTYRGGIPYCASMKDMKNMTVDRNNIESRIKKHEFDIVIVFGSFTKQDQTRLKISDGCFPYGSIVENHYDSSEICFIDGRQNPTDTEVGVQQFIHRGQFFRREYMK